MLIITKKTKTLFCLLLLPTNIFVFCLFSINHRMVVALSLGFGLNSTVPLRDHLRSGFCNQLLCKKKKKKLFCSSQPRRVLGCEQCFFTFLTVWLHYFGGGCLMCLKNCFPSGGKENILIVPKQGGKHGNHTAQFDINGISFYGWKKGV